MQQSKPKVQQDFCGYAGVRVGEASRPGPPTGCTYFSCHFFGTRNPDPEHPDRCRHCTRPLPAPTTPQPKRRRSPSFGRQSSEEDALGVTPGMPPLRGTAAELETRRQQLYTPTSPAEDHNEQATQQGEVEQFLETYAQHFGASWETAPAEDARPADEALVQPPPRLATRELPAAS